MARETGRVPAPRCRAHDRYFLVTCGGLELDRGAGIPYEGNYSSWLDQKRTRLATEEKQASARQRTLERELEWVRMSPRARQSKSKARIQKYEELASAAGDEKVMQNEIVIPPPARLGNDVVIAKGLKKAYGDKVLFDDLSFSLPRGGIVGIIGANGAGKTTLQNDCGNGEADDGPDDRDTVQIAYVDQGRELNEDNTVYKEVSEGRDVIQVGKREMQTRAYLASFNFKGADQQKKVKDLSGGERNRLHLSKLLKSGGNLLLLDEPTNDLDVDTLRALEESLLASPAARRIPRPLVPRPDRHAHPRVRGEFGDGVVRGVLSRLRRRFQETEGSGCG